MEAKTHPASSASDTVTSQCPRHWSDKYVGHQLEFHHSEDCVDFVKRVIQAEWQYTLTWPFEDKTQLDKLLNQTAQIKQAEKIKQTAQNTLNSHEDNHSRDESAFNRLDDHTLVRLDEPEDKPSSC